MDTKPKGRCCMFDLLNVTANKCSQRVSIERLSSSELLYLRQISLNMGAVAPEYNQSSQMKSLLKSSKYKLMLLITGILALILIIMIAFFSMQLSKRFDCKPIEQDDPSAADVFRQNCLRAPALQPYHAELKERFRSFQHQLKQRCLDEIKEDHLQNISINAFYDGNELFRLSMDKEDEDGQDHLYPIASITKVFTAMLLYKMEQNGQVQNIDDDVRNQNYFPNLKIVNDFNKENITLRAMTCQMSGLTREGPCYHQSKENYCPFNTSTILKRLNNTRLITPPREFPSYSNLAFALLGRALEKRFNMPYEELIRKHILTPLGMNNTRFHDKSSDVALNTGTPIESNVTDWGWLRPAAGLFSTVGDLGKLSRALVGDGSFLRHSTGQKMLGAVYDFPDGSSQGCPFEIQNYKRKNQVSYRIYAKKGSTDGYYSLFILIPSFKLNINLLTKGNGLSIYNIGFNFVLPNVIDIFERWMIKENKVKYQLPPNPTQYIGQYQLKSIWPLITKPANITQENHQLFLYLEWLKVPLTFISQSKLRTGDFGFISSHYNCDVLSSGLIGMELTFNDVRIQNKAISFTINNVAAYGLLRFERIF